MVVLDSCKSKDTYEICLYEDLNNDFGYKKLRKCEKFVKDTHKVLEKQIDLVILDILREFNIDIELNNHSSCKSALNDLKALDREIDFENLKIDGTIFDRVNGFDYKITSDNFIAVGVKVKYGCS